MQVEVFEGGTERFTCGKPCFHFVADVAVEFATGNLNLLYLWQSKEADGCLFGIEVVDAGAGAEIDFLNMTIIPLHTEDADSTLLHAFDESPVGRSAASAVTGPGTLLLGAVVGLAVEVP